MKTDKPITYATPAQTDDMTRRVLIWLSAYPEIPNLVQPEPMLAAGQDGMELTVISHAITNPYIYGGYKAEYQFGIFYRLVKPSGPNERLTALQDLNKLGNYAPYENGDEDYQILMKLTYEVI